MKTDTIMEEIKSLFEFIDFMKEKQNELIGKMPLIDKLVELDSKCSKLDRNKIKERDFQYSSYFSNIKARVKGERTTLLDTQKKLLMQRLEKLDLKPPKK